MKACSKARSVRRTVNNPPSFVSSNDAPTGAQEPLSFWEKAIPCDIEFVKRTVEIEQYFAIKGSPLVNETYLNHGWSDPYYTTPLWAEDTWPSRYYQLQKRDIPDIPRLVRNTETTQ